MLIVYAHNYSSALTDECPVWTILQEEPFNQIIVAEQMKPLQSAHMSPAARAAAEQAYPTIGRKVIKKIYDELRYARMFKEDLWLGKHAVRASAIDTAFHRIPLLLATGKPRFKVRTR